MSIAMTRSDTRDGNAPNATSGAAWIIASHALRSAFRDRTVLWLTALFLIMVLLSAYLGWSATTTTRVIYAAAVEALRAEGRPAPPDPTLSESALTLLRNMTTYISLIGALVAIVLGHQLIVDDRRSGSVPLIASKPFAMADYAYGKIVALAIIILGLLLVSCLANAATLFFLAGPKVTAGDWANLVLFYGVSFIYLLGFGLGALAAGAYFQSESVSLLVPVIIWLALLFILPQLASNINPMAALNPIKAMVPPPGGTFFDTVGVALAPVSLTSTYRDLATTLLGFTPANAVTLGVLGGLASLVVADLVLLFTARHSLLVLDPTRSDLSE